MKTQDPTTKNDLGFKSLDDYQEAYNLEKVDANPANWGRGIEEPEEPEDKHFEGDWDGEDYD